MRRMLAQIVEVSGIVVDKKGDILLVKTQHGGLVLPGGQVKEGEDLMDALTRAIKEESGIDVIVSYLIGVYSNSGKYHSNYHGTTFASRLVFDFMCTPLDEEMLASEETSFSLWLEKDKVLGMVEASDIQTRYQAYMNFDGSSFFLDAASTL
ncbi:NUDIX hydrolase [Paenibacillus sp. P36]|uniref:NUDIX hydrolase n=1 Tax=Paenibacillus sp. P36 TaxID=3342538 RepID=UPI0038B2EF93